MAMTTALAFMISSSPVPLPITASTLSRHNRPPTTRRNSSGLRVEGLPCSLRPLSARLSVCTEDDCRQQGASQTLAKLRKIAKGQDVRVDSCACLGMCGLGPCVQIDWGGSRISSRGGIEPDVDGILRTLVEDAAKAPAPSQPKKQERDPYAEQ